MATGRERFDKFEARCALGYQSAYRMLDERWRRHHARYRSHVQAMARPLLCQECGGSGKYDDEWLCGYPRAEMCGWCEGTGRLTPWLRGLWLREQRRR